MRSHTEAMEFKFRNSHAPFPEGSSMTCAADRRWARFPDGGRFPDADGLFVSGWNASAGGREFTDGR